MKQLDIKIIGMAGNGKTTIAKIICDALKEKGFKFNLLDDSIDNDKLQECRINALKDNVGINVITVESRKIDPSWTEINK